MLRARAGHGVPRRGGGTATRLPTADSLGRALACPAVHPSMNVTVLTNTSMAEPGALHPRFDGQGAPRPGSAAAAALCAADTRARAADGTLTRSFSAVYSREPPRCAAAHDALHAPHTRNFGLAPQQPPEFARKNASIRDFTNGRDRYQASHTQREMYGFLRSG